MRATKAILSGVEELAPLRRLRSPMQLQQFINALAPHKQRKGETCSPARVTLGRGSAQCAEGALVAAAWCVMHGHPPMLLDLKTTSADIGHVVALYRHNGYWGAVSRSSHASLRYRDPIYRNVRELAMSYFHEYFNDAGKKTLRYYSKPFSLAGWDAEWATGTSDLWQLLNCLDAHPHVRVLTRAQISRLKDADEVEVRAGKLLQKGARA